MATQILEPQDARWLALAASNPQANIFHHPAWMELLAECYGYHPFVLTIDNPDGEICAGLPLMEVDSFLTGRRWVSLPFSDHCSPIYRETDGLPLLTKALVEFANDKAIPRVDLHWEYPPQSGFQLASRYFSHSIKLNSDSQQVLAHFHPMHQRNIRTSQKRGVGIELTTQSKQLVEFYRLHLETRRRQGIPIQPYKFFDLLGHYLLEQGHGFLIQAYAGRECIATALFLHWHRIITYKYGASRPDSQTLRPNNLLFWTAIRWGCENGYTQFDLGRTDISQTGLRNFKQGWGADEMPLTYSTLSSRPPHPSDGLLKYILQNVIRRSPPWVCRALGELLYRHYA